MHMNESRYTWQYAHVPFWCGSVLLLHSLHTSVLLLHSLHTAETRHTYVCSWDETYICVLTHCTLVYYCCTHCTLRRRDIHMSHDSFDNKLIAHCRDETYICMHIHLYTYLCSVRRMQLWMLHDAHHNMHMYFFGAQALNATPESGHTYVCICIYIHTYALSAESKCECVTIQIITKGICICSKEPNTFSKEPHIFLKEPYIWALYILKRVCIVTYVCIYMCIRTSALSAECNCECITMHITICTCTFLAR